jgi:S1-C subfamily serine protease
MKHFLTLLIFAVSAACCPANSPSGAPSNTSVALIRTTDDGDMKPFCSGNFVGERLILTASHCVSAYEEKYEQDDDSVKIAFLMPGEVGDDGQPVALHQTRLVRIDRDKDLALLIVLQKDFRHQFAKVAEQEPNVWDNVWTMGTPRGLYFSAGNGIVSSAARLLPTSDFNGWFIQIGAPETWYGSSGSAVFNDSGEILGIVSMTANANALIFITDTAGTRNFVKEK